MDGYNLLLSEPELRRMIDSEGLHAARSALVSRVAAHAKARGASATVVFDGSTEVIGAARDETVHGVRCVYSIGEGKADRRIVRLLEEESRPGDCVVVSSDREVMAAAKHRGARVRGALAFWRDGPGRASAEKPGASEGLLPPDEVDEWMRYFGFDSEDEPGVEGGDGFEDDG